MATTEQRSGFRLPWTADSRTEAVHPAPMDGASPEIQAADPAAPTTDPSQPEAIVTQDPGTATIDPRLAAWPEIAGAAGTGPGDPESMHDEAAVAADDATTDAGIGDAADATAGAQGAATGTPVAAAGRQRRDNPLVQGLVRAMRDAAHAARAEADARFAEDAKARIAAIHDEATEAATAIRRAADDDVAAIREWSKAEIARIREETEERIGARKRRLELEVEDHAAQVEHRIDGVQRAVDKFGAEMDAFFEQLLAEEDPARVAGLAERLPEPPSLEAAGDLGAWSPGRSLDADGAAAAEAEALAVLDDSPDDGADLPEPATATATLGTPVSATGAAPTSPDAADAAVMERLERFTGKAVGLADETFITTRLSVVGLVSVASIAGFKRALTRTPGVRSASVASGPGGDFVFTVQHTDGTDLRTVLPALGGFEASITGDADGVLSVTAADPDRTH